MLRVAQMEQRASATFDEGYEDLPTDYLELREIRINTNPAKSQRYVTGSTPILPSLRGM
jgi:hypothetical protein